MKRRLSDAQVREIADKTRARRLKWFQEARFGMFVHWGSYAVHGRGEWAMNQERMPIPEYEKLADAWKPKARPMREWAKLAVEAGMKYMVLTTKHHDGFCLWDTGQTNYNSVRRGPRRDLVREYVETCREHGLKVGLYYSLLDWHHPDGAKCAVDKEARARFLEFTRGCVRELMTDYGRIDVLWYDGVWPFNNAEGWDSERLNATVRRLQPAILVNNRAMTPEDFGTPEERVQAEKQGRAWEACMTFNGAWGYYPAIPDEAWRTPRDVITMLRTATAGAGNLLFNIGPEPDGSVPSLARERLRVVGKWLARHGEAVYGKVDRTDGQVAGGNTGGWTLKGNTGYFWMNRWPGSWIAIGGLLTRVRKITYLDSGNVVSFRQTERQLIVEGLPAKCPEKIAGYPVLKVEFTGKPRQVLGSGYVTL